MPATFDLMSPTPASEAKRFSALLDIADRALAADEAAQDRRAQEQALSDAYVHFKAVNDLENVENDSPEWAAMMTATRDEYADAEKAKRAEYNARRRMQTAIRSYRNL